MDSHSYRFYKRGGLALKCNFNLKRLSPIANSLGSGGRVCASTSVINVSGFYPGILFLLLFVLELLPGYIHPLTAESGKKPEYVD